MYIIKDNEKRQILENMIFQSFIIFFNKYFKSEYLFHNHKTTELINNDIIGFEYFKIFIKNNELNFNIYEVVYFIDLIILLRKNENIKNIKSLHFSEDFSKKYCLKNFKKELDKNFIKFVSEPQQIQNTTIISLFNKLNKRNLINEENVIFYKKFL